MLTVKHITLSGTEMIIPASRVWFYPSDDQKQSLKAVPQGSGMVTVVPPQSAGLLAPHEDLHGGTVFVMNEHGKTVSRYDLGASMVPMDHRGDDGRAVRAA